MAFWAIAATSFLFWAPEADRLQAWAPVDHEIMVIEGERIPASFPADAVGYLCSKPTHDSNMYVVRSNNCRSVSETNRYGWPWPDNPPVWWVQDFQSADSLGISVVWVRGTYMHWWDVDMFSPPGASVGPADWNVDRTVDVADLLAFLEEWFDSEGDVAVLVDWLEEWFRRV